MRRVRQCASSKYEVNYFAKVKILECKKVLITRDVALDSLHVDESSPDGAWVERVYSNVGSFFL